MPLVLRSVKGSNLTPAEVDGNFTFLQGLVDGISATIPAPVSVSNITKVGRSIYIYLTDSSEFGPFTLPNAVAETQTENVEPDTGDTLGRAVITPAATDAGKYFRVLDPDGAIYEVPSDAELDFPINTEIHFRQCTPDGFVWILASTAVILNGITGYEERTAREGAVITVKKIAADEWDVMGFLGIATASSSA
ncbi:MAG: hypothetical protein VW338_04715 [Rhodospirillaceae bacterium]